MDDPFNIPGPSVLNVSGGRTSGYMLRRVLDRFGGTLPPDCVAVFCNTGREMPATLDFVQRMAVEWSVHIHWLEYRWEPGRHYYEEVSHNSASRAGEPFDQFIAGKKALPNPVQRSCTSELKVKTTKRFIIDRFGWKNWNSIVGIRADEPSRHEKPKKATVRDGTEDLFGQQEIKKPKPRKKDRWTVLHPLFHAGITKVDVLRFWREQSFDLELAGEWEGNCDGCFMKSRAALIRMMQDHPERMAWWPQKEFVKLGAGNGRYFRNDRDNYSKMAATAKSEERIPFSWLEEHLPCTSGGCGT